MSFQYPYLLFLLLLLPLMFIYQRYYDKRKATNIIYSDISQFATARKTFKLRIRQLPDYFRMLAVALIIIAIARPQLNTSKDEKSIEGIDIVLTLDVSTSMLAEDFKPNRLESAKSVAKEFIENRKNDNIGIVVFAGEAYTKCPSTIDHTVLLNLLSSTESGQIDDGTAIGDGLATAINRVKDTKAKSKVIILITDGVNNMGAIDPLTAASIAKEYNIRIYTIGIGKKGHAPYPFYTPFGKQYQNVEVKIDEDLLKEVANTTGGQYFRSTKNSSLQEIFKEIDKMEKTKIDVSLYKHTKDIGGSFILLALIILIIEMLLRKTYLRTNP
ncbi:MAG: VWA domain-containing protein [Bacteroidales bacterium]|nr:VWA domain-containing protein [Bacteroidales bacterium]